MAELHWFPIYHSDWLASGAIAAMLPEQEGAYMRLLMIAWGNGEAEPSLPASSQALAQMSRLGARWKKLGPLILEQFDEREGRIYHPKLSEVWAEQQQKHAVAVAKGKKGGDTKAAKRKLRDSSEDSSTPSPASSSARAEEVAEGVAIQNLEGAVVAQPLPGQGPLPAPAPDGALAPAGAAPRATGARAEYRPERSEQEKLLDDAYEARLRERADIWFGSNPDDTTAMTATALVELGIAEGAELKSWQQRALYAALLEAYRVRRKLPTRDVWVAECLAGTREWPAGVPQLAGTG